MNRTFLISLLLLQQFLTTAQEQPARYGDNPKSGGYAEVNGIKMYYEIYGEGQPLVLIHGNGGSVFSSREQIPFFSKHYKVIVPESRAQGKTNDNGDSLTYDQMASDLNALLDYLKIDSAYIFGQSDGAILGLILGFRYPKKVRMLAAMAPNTRPDNGAIYPEGVAAMEKRVKQLEDSVKTGDKKYITEMKLNRLMLYHPHISDKELAQIKAPVMIMSGDRDIVSLTHIMEIFRAIPRSQLCVLPGSTHFALRQNATVFNETIYRFFTRPFDMPNTLSIFK